MIEKRGGKISRKGMSSRLICLDSISPFQLSVSSCSVHLLRRTGSRSQISGLGWIIAPAKLKQQRQCLLSAGHLIPTCHNPFSSSSPTHTYTHACTHTRTLSDVHRSPRSNSGFMADGLNLAAGLFRFSSQSRIGCCCSCCSTMMMMMMVLCHHYSMTEVVNSVRVRAVYCALHPAGS